MLASHSCRADSLTDRSLHLSWPDRNASWRRVVFVVLRSNVVRKPARKPISFRRRSDVDVVCIVEEISGSMSNIALSCKFHPSRAICVIAAALLVRSCARIRVDSGHLPISMCVWLFTGYGFASDCEGFPRNIYIYIYNMHLESFTPIYLALRIAPCISFPYTEFSTEVY